MSAVLVTTTTFAPTDRPWQRAFTNRSAAFGGIILLIIFLTCLFTLPFSLNLKNNFYFDLQHQKAGQLPPQLHPAWMWFGTTKLGQSLLGRCLVGGVISLTIGIAAAAISV